MASLAHENLNFSIWPVRPVYVCRRRILYVRMDRIVYVRSLLFSLYTLMLLDTYARHSYTHTLAHIRNTSLFSPYAEYMHNTAKEPNLIGSSWLCSVHLLYNADIVVGGTKKMLCVWVVPKQMRWTNKKKMSSLFIYFETQFHQNIFSSCIAMSTDAIFHHCLCYFVTHSMHIFGYNPLKSVFIAKTRFVFAFPLSCRSVSPLFA